MATTSFNRRRAAREIDGRESIARQDLALEYAEIFLPRMRGKRGIVEVEKTYAGVTLEITAPELDATDLAVLLAIQTIAARAGKETIGAAVAGLVPSDDADEAQGRPNRAAELDAIKVETTEGDVAVEIGRSRDDGAARLMIRKSLKYLAMVVFSGTAGDTWGLTHLIAPSRSRGGKLSIGLNYRAARAILGSGQWAAIDMRKFVAANDVTRIVMHRLAAHCTGRAPRAITLQRLAAVCWPSTRPPANDRRRRERIAQIRQALPAATPAGYLARIEGNKVTFVRA